MSSDGPRWFKYASPVAFYPLAGKLIPWFVVPTVLLTIAGLYMSFFVAPTDYRQGEAYRIMFIHVPAAWMSMWLYVCMAVYAALGLVVQTRLSSMMAQAIAPTGAMFTFIALWTGAFWGRPMWGTWWVWDARLTSELILLFLYIGVMALRSAIDEPRRADRASGLLCLVGVVNVPIIYYSVQWWNTLHQGASISMTADGSPLVQTRLSSMMAQAIAPTGAMFTFIALWTGAFWGRPMWGTWWVWDARLTSELILLFLYIGVMALRSAIDEPRRADRASGLLCLVGVVNVPIIYYSVQWWNTLHQGASISMTAAPSMGATMLWTLLVMTFAFWAYSFVTCFKRVRTIILERERHAEWVADLVDNKT